MQPGLTRAIPMAFLGFIFGALFVIVLRALQGVEPLWDPQLGLVMCAFTITAGFVWGMGAFDPRMNQHAHEPSEHDEDASAHPAPEPEPRSVSILGYSMGQVATWTVVLMIVLFAYAIFGGRYVRTTSDPIASPANIGFMPVQVPFSGDYITWNGEVVLFSELTLFVMFVVITLGSLVIAGGAIAGVFYLMSRGVTEVKGVQNSALLLSSGEVIAQKRSTTTNDNLIALIKLVIALVVLYAAFYFVLVGGLWLVFPTWPQWIRVSLSVVNAVIFAVIIVQPPFLMRPLGESSRRLARTLRRISAE